MNARDRQQHALELNDGVLQSMVVAQLALDLGDVERAREALDAAIAAASHLLTSLVGDSPAVDLQLSDRDELPTADDTPDTPDHPAGPQETP